MRLIFRALSTKIHTIHSLASNDDCIYTDLLPIGADVIRTDYTQSLAPTHAPILDKSHRRSDIDLATPPLHFD